MPVGSSEPRIVGVMRIKNEARWISRVIKAQLPWVERLFIFDDHSTDRTREICRRFKKVQLIESPFEGLDESRDKQYILDRAFEWIPVGEVHGKGRWWALALDGDEVLCDGAKLQRLLARKAQAVCYAVRILYLWNSEDKVRVDGVYQQFYRPSIFRLINRAFRYQKTPFGNGANFHCSSIPQEYLHYAHRTRIRVLHLGYLHREDRLRKYEWYNRIDPRNRNEDGYAHMVMGDLPQFPPSERRLHAGPLRLKKLKL